MIFAWLAATYFRAVPMDSYPTSPAPATAKVPVEAQEPSAAATSAEESANVVTTETASRREQ